MDKCLWHVPVTPPPPPQPPADAPLLATAWVYFSAALLLFLCFSCCGIYHHSDDPRSPIHERGQGRDRIAYWCCCLVPFWRSDGNHWDQQERDARNSKARETLVPPMMIPNGR
jgi:hypothetical protein